MSITDLLFPKKCLFCTKKGNYLCPECVGKMKFADTVCPECQRPSIDGFTHIKCRKPLGIDGLISIWTYTGVLRKAVIALKYKYATGILDEMVKEILPVLRKNMLLSTADICLVPIPLYWYRENVRGFNQSAELGKKIAISMNWKIDPGLLRRKRNTLPQVKLKGSERRKNVSGAFEFTPYPEPVLKDGLYIVFDDVYTTGSTIRETAKILKKAGAAKVWGMTVCH